MSGRPKNKVFVYATNGSYIQTFSSENDFRKAYYPEDNGKRPIFQWQELGFDYHLNLSYEIIAFKEKPGRDKVRLIVSIHQSEFCKNSDYNDKPVQVFNLKGELIAEFRSQRIFKKLCPDRYNNLATSLSKSDKILKYRIKNPPGGLFFKYKEIDHGTMV